jgi:hypothetical protein
MAGFLYFVPHGQRLPAEIEQRLEGCKHERRVLGAGPGGTPGMLYGGRTYGEISLGYYPADQTWRQSGQVWIGAATDSMPTPADLQRSHVLPGTPVTLAGLDWLIPTARSWNEGGSYSITLPRKADISPDGEWTMGDIVQRYQSLWQACCKYWDWYTNQTTLTNADLFEMSCQALASQYQVGKCECVMLGLIDEESSHLIMRTVCDLDSLEAILAQKKIHDTCNTCDGELAEILVTVQP